MRILLIALLLTGCSMAELRESHQASLDDQQNNALILHAEYECAGNGLVIGTREYDKCLDEELKGEPELKAQLDKLRAEFAKRAADGTLDADRQCESFGYYRNTSEYNICLEYARENNIGGAGKSKNKSKTSQY